jgi:hypothetical protein
VIIVKSDKELFKLARHYVMLIDGFEKAVFDHEEFKEEMDKIRNAVLKEGYNVDKFVEYQELYRKISIEEYYEFIKTLN